MDNPTFFSSILLLLYTDIAFCLLTSMVYSKCVLFASSQFYKLDDLNASGPKPNYAAESLEDGYRNLSTIICE
jgi:hypothetical protein